ncbi:MAG: flagellar hook-length control protein FliK [Solirubrobacteraceae bacterium]|nr:flagellar hook-length control protein FliK [Solirubrobacteraceae bacterium]
MTPAIDAAPTASGATASGATATSAGVSDLPGAPHQRHAVGLGQAVDTIRLLIQAADQRGIARARIALRPQELGGVEVHLRHGADGLTARLIVDSAQSATLIQQAADDLRRSLEQQGISVAGLEVSLSGERDAAAGAGAGAERDERHDGPGGAGAAHRPHDGDDDPHATTQTIELPGGALVDVLA